MIWPSAHLTGVNYLRSLLGSPSLHNYSSPSAGTPSDSTKVPCQPVAYRYGVYSNTKMALNEGIQSA